MEKGKEDCQWISWLTQVWWTGLHWLMPGCPPQGAGQCPPAGIWKKSTWQPQSKCPFSSVLKLQAHVANVGPHFACHSQQYGLLIYLLWTSSALEPLSRSFSPQPCALSYHLILSNSFLFFILLCFSEQFPSIMLVWNPSPGLFPLDVGRYSLSHPAAERLCLEVRQHLHFSPPSSCLDAPGSASQGHCWIAKPMTN